MQPPSPPLPSAYPAAKALSPTLHFHFHSLHEVMPFGWDDSTPLHKKILNAHASREPAWLDLCFPLSTVGTPFATCLLHTILVLCLYFIPWSCCLCVSDRELLEGRASGSVIFWVHL